MEVPESTGGTKDSPLMVPSMFDERIVGCMCKLCCGCITFVIHTVFVKWFVCK